MHSINPHQQLFQAIANLSDQQASVVLKFISTLEISTNNDSPPSQTVLERMGGYPEFLLEGKGDLSDRDVRKKAIAVVSRQ